MIPGESVVGRGIADVGSTIWVCVTPAQAAVPVVTQLRTTLVKGTHTFRVLMCTGDTFYCFKNECLEV